MLVVIVFLFIKIGETPSDPYVEGQRNGEAPLGKFFAPSEKIFWT